MSDLDELNKILNNTGIEFSLLSLNEAKNLVKVKYFDRFVTDNFPNEDTVNEISVARSIIQYFSYKNTTDGDIVYVLDEDMQLSSVYRKNGSLNLRKSILKDLFLTILAKLMQSSGVILEMHQYQRYLL